MTDYRPGNVYCVTHNDDPANTTYAASFVGTQPLWSDDSDSSHVDFGQTEPATNYTAQARANFAAIPASDTYSLLVRADSLSSVGAPQIAFQDVGVTEMPFTEYLTIGALGWYETGQFTIGPATAAAPMVYVNNFGTGMGGSSTIDFRIYEVLLRSHSNAAQSYLAPRRLHPREDGRGLGAGRVYPQPRSLQNGVRQVGGYL